MVDALEYRRLLRVLTSHYDEQKRVWITGVAGASSSPGATVTLRFVAARACEWVTVHVQHDGVGGGGATYNTSTYVSRTRRDLRADRQRDETITRDAANDYFVWLIPEELLPDGSYATYDGVSADDLMSFRELGV